MIVTFVGHRTIGDYKEIFDKVKKYILCNFPYDEQICFYCGGYGDFDNLCAAVCMSIKKQRSGVEVVYVTPYMTLSHQAVMQQLIDGGVYDSVLYPPLENVLPRFAISERNKWMVDCADVIIAYVHRGYGGAYKTLAYAQRKNKKVINLANGCV